MTEAGNRVCLEGTVLPDREQRWTPAGLPIVRFALEHSSRVTVAGLERVVQCRLTVVALGEELARQAQALPDGGPCRVDGLLAQRVRRRPGQEPVFGRTELHATALAPLDHSDESASTTE